ncbi:MAG: ABC transporter permease [Desulfurococcales archaeon]|nr:ABC transporter permease [Desulfurococcales archaeon]
MATKAASEVYKKKILDRFSDALIDSVASFLDKIRPGWKVRNQARVDEWKLMFYAFNRSPLGIAGAILVLAFLLLAIIGPWVAPFSYDTSLALCNQQAYLAPPKTTVTISAGCEALGVKPGNYTLYLGGDSFGRDLGSRMLFGARTSFVVMIFVLLVGPWIGIALGLISGYFGGSTDEVIMRTTDIFLVFPGLILAIAFSAVLPSRISGFLASHHYISLFFLHLFSLKPQHEGSLASLLSVIIALWIVWWPGYARLVRGMVLSEKENTYVEAAKALGIPSRSILVRHIMPNISGPILVYLSLDSGGVILTEAGLSFLGVGAVPPIADWGRIIYDGSQYFPNAWWLIFFPGLAIFLTVLGFNLLGDVLRDVLDPRTRRSIEFKLKKKVEVGEEQ